MKKTIQYVILGVIAVVIVVFAVNMFKKTAGTLLGGGEEGAVTVKALAADDEVIVTSDNDTYHRVSCDKLRGPTYRSTYAEVKDNMEACPSCLAKRGGE